MTRDFTAREYKQAAERQGFTVWPFGLEDSKGRRYGAVMRGPHKMLRRETLARALKLRDKKPIPPWQVRYIARGAWRAVPRRYWKLDKAMESATKMQARYGFACIVASNIGQDPRK